MSNPGQGVIAVVGGIVGFVVGGPTGAAWGFQLGMAGGSALFPTQLPGVTGPQLTDERTTTSEVGADIPDCWGMMTVGGNVIYKTADIRKVVTSEESGGKGGPQQTVSTNHYYQTIAVRLARGLQKGVLAIFENGDLKYDVRPQREDETTEEWEARAEASQAYAQTFQFYPGDEEQLPDPTIEAELGVGTVPAWRGTCYLVFPQREIRQDQGFRHPSFLFLIYNTLAVDECEQRVRYANEVLHPWLAGNDPRNPLNAHVYHAGALGSLPAGGYDTAAAAIEVLYAPSGSCSAQKIASHYITWHTDNDIWSGLFGIDANTFDSPGLKLQYGGEALDAIVRVDDFGDIPGTHPACRAMGLLASHDTVLFYQGDATHVSEEVNIYSRQAGCGIGAFLDAGDYTECVLPFPVFRTGAMWAISVHRKPVAPINPCDDVGALPSEINGYCLIDGEYTQATPWVLVLSTDFSPARTFKVLRKYGVNISAENIYPLGPCVGSNEANYSNAGFWTAAYNAAVVAGDMPAGLVYNTHYPQTQGYAYQRTFNVCTVKPGPVSLARIVRDVCLDCGLTEDQFDVADLEEIYVHGYRRARMCPGRAVIDPLRSAGFFDIVESAGKLKFITRGKEPVMELTEEDLGARAPDGARAPLMTTEMIEDTELPKRLIMRYIAPSRDYETGEQPSPERQITRAKNEMKVDVPIALEDDQAAQCAEVIWADLWSSRWTHRTQLGRKHLALEPADVILAPVEDRLQRLRVVSFLDSLPMIRRTELVRDDAGSYVSTAIGQAPPRPPATIRIYGPTELILLDLPALRDTDDDPGLYVAARRISGNHWLGAAIYRSADGGATFAEVGSITSEAIDGELVDALPAGTTATWDGVNEIIVDLNRGELSSASETSVLAGTANAAVVGAPGRWELVQWLDAEQVAEKRYRLTNLLRGRRGTEHFVGTSVAGDRFVLLMNVVRLPATLADRGAERIYRGISFNTPSTTGINQTYYGNAQALVPFSPVDIAGEREGGDLTITWTRRGRLGQEAPDGADIALSEESEAYEVDIIDGTSSAVVRTLAVTTPTAVYTAAQQVDDWGTPPAEVEVRIYQISATVGRGTPGEATL